MSLPTPYYQSDKATLYCGDCLDILPGLSGVDAVVTDPPYGIGFNHDGGGGGIWERRNEGKIIGDDRPFDPKPWLLFDDVIFWGANHFADRLPKSAGWLVWDKKLGLKEDNFSDGEAAWHKRGTRLRIFRYLWNGLLAHERDQKREHIMQKPVALMRWCLEFVVADTILDPFTGSGTTGVAAVKLGRKFIGIEIEPKYCEIAKRRIIEAEDSYALFEPPTKRETPMLEFAK